MSIRFVWDEEYSVGNIDIDEQHKKLFALVNAVPEAPDARLIKSTIMELFKYAREHFSGEEQMMKQIGYDKLEQHRELHEELITKLSKLGTQSFDTPESIHQFRGFVYAWLIDHIMQHDRACFRLNPQVSC